MRDTGTMIHIPSLIDETTCFETVRALRWPDGVRCPTCDSPQITTHGREETPPERQRYPCQSCRRRFDEVTETSCAGQHPPLRVWMLCRYFRGLTLSNHHMAPALDRNQDDGHQISRQLRQGMVTQQPPPT